MLHSPRRWRSGRGGRSFHRLFKFRRADLDIYVVAVENSWGARGRGRADRQIRASLGRLGFPQHSVFFRLAVMRFKGALDAVVSTARGWYPPLVLLSVHSLYIDNPFLPQLPADVDEGLSQPLQHFCCGTCKAYKGDFYMCSQRLWYQRVRKQISDFKCIHKMHTALDPIQKPVFKHFSIVD